MSNETIGLFRKHPYSEWVICPRCNKNILPMGYPGALSRADNLTEVCSPCGEDEALGQWLDKHLASVSEWPVEIKYSFSKGSYGPK